MSTPIDLTTLAAFFALVTTLLMQGVKPLLELIPGMRLASNKNLHDWAIRFVQYLINFALLIVASRTLPSVFAGMYWWDLLSIAFGQGVLSHFTYSVVSAGGSDTVDDTATPAVPPVGTLPEIPR